MPPKIPGEIQEKVRQRANFLCEYCHTSERWQYVRFTLDHIIPISNGGDASLENLALACFHCNRKKAGNQTVVDVQSGNETPIFNPRSDKWTDHFRWEENGTLIVAKTEIGIVTVDLLQLNRERILPIRGADIEINRHPPQEDLE